MRSPSDRARSWTSFAAAAFVLAIWTLFLLRDFLDFDPLMIPPGKEFFTETQGHFVWERARECGLCAMWNSNVHGGNPAFADPLSAFLYPPVIVGSLIWGAINGAKAALIVTFFLAGMAQWWLGSVLGLGRVARLWAAAMAIAAGGLAGRLDDGDLPIITSTVACMVAIPAAIKLTRDGTRRSAAVLGGAIALMLVAGQAYLQITFAMLSPLFLVFVSGNRLGARHLAKRFGLAVAIGVMIAAPFLVPLLHFYPSFSKPIDPTFSLTQPFRYIPLNLVVSDRSLYKSDQLGTAPFPYLYINYLGWIAVIFAAIGCYTLWRRHDYRLLGFLVSWSVGAMWISSAMPLRWIRDITAPGDPVHDFVIGLRSMPIVAGLAIPSILALSAIGVDGLVKSRRRGLSLLWQMPTGPDRAVRLDARWLLVIPLLFALRSEQRFAEHFLYSTRQPIEAMTPVLDALTTPDSQWVDAPYGEELWIGQAAKRNLKLSYIGRSGNGKVAAILSRSSRR